MYTRLRTLLLILVQSTEIHVAIRGRCVLVFCRFYLLVCVQMHERCNFKMLWKLRNGKDVTCGQVWWPILGICALHLTHPSATTNTHTHTHTHREHTPGAVGMHFILRHPGAVGVRCLAQGTSVVVLRRECWTFTPPTYNSCRTWDSNPWPLGYKSDSLSIRPRLLKVVGGINTHFDNPTE